MMHLLAAAIAFGPLGPVRHVTMRDGSVRADIAYRIAHDRDHDTGEAAVSPSIAAGTLTLVVGGRRRTIDLASIFPIRTDRVVIAVDPPRDGCGVTRTFTRTARYLAIEAELAEKGCAPIAAFVDLSSGTVAESTVLDPAWAHRFDATPDRFDGVRLRVARVDRIVLQQAVWDATGRAPSRVAWRFGVASAIAGDGAARLVAFGLDPDGFAQSGRSNETVPHDGSTIDVGDLIAPVGSYPVRYFTGERVVRLSVSDDARFASMQTPTPPDVERTARRNAWFQHAADEAAAGRLDAAVHAYATMLTYESDPSLAASEKNILARCRALAASVRNGSIGAATASASFPGGCSATAIVPK